MTVFQCTEFEFHPDMEDHIVSVHHGKLAIIKSHKINNLTREEIFHVLKNWDATALDQLPEFKRVTIKLINLNK